MTKIEQQNQALILCVRLREAGKLKADGCSFSGSYQEFAQAISAAQITGFAMPVRKIAYDLCRILDS